METNTNVNITLTNKTNLEQAFNIRNIKKLTIAGEIGRLSFEFINKHMAQTLSELDISNATIIEEDNEWIEILVSSKFTHLKSISLGASIKDHTYTCKRIGHMLVSYGSPERYEYTKIYSLFDISSLANIDIHPNNPIYYSKEGVVFKKIEYKGSETSVDNIGDKYSLVRFPPTKSKHHYVVPDFVARIEEKAFAGCSELISITLPNTISSIKKEAFTHCVNLKTINIPDSVVEIGANAFEGCKTLENIILPKNLTIIADYTFEYCESLRQITIPESVTKIGTYAFAKSGLKNISIPTSIEEINKGAFRWCENLEQVTLPNTIKIIEESTFQQCNSLKQITIPDSVIQIDYDAFYASGLESVIIPKSVETINVGAFSECKALKQITFSNSKICIKSYAFNRCLHLMHITIPNFIPDIEDDAFNNCPDFIVENLEIPNDTEENN